MNFVTGDAGADEFVFNQTWPATTTARLPTFNAGKSTDRIALDTTEQPALLYHRTYDLGSVGTCR